MNKTKTGRPNVGKSSLTNALVGEKIAIVSNKPQTTRNRIYGIVNDGDTQIVLLDTPGFHKAKNRLGDYMMKTISTTMAEVDAAILVIEPLSKVGPAEKEIMRRLKDLRPDTPILVCGGCTDQKVPRAQEIFAKGILDKLRAEAPTKWANMTFLTGVGMLPQDSECTHDHCHPNDYGAMQMSKVYAEAVSRILRRGDTPRKAQ